MPATHSKTRCRFFVPTRSVLNTDTNWRTRIGAPNPSPVSRDLGSDPFARMFVVGVNTARPLACTRSAPSVGCQIYVLAPAAGSGIPDPPISNHALINIFR